ncbi:MAG: hypothetical protein AAF585_21005 [Verrucomicrobiota bacterium]
MDQTSNRQEQQTGRVTDVLNQRGTAFSLFLSDLFRRLWITADVDHPGEVNFIKGKLDTRCKKREADPYYDAR